jgi:hypothetical protein
MVGSLLIGRLVLYLKYNTKHGQKSIFFIHYTRISLWDGVASVDFHLFTKAGTYEFTLDTRYSPPMFTHNIIIEDTKYELFDILPYPVHGEEPSEQSVILLFRGQ